MDCRIGIDVGGTNTDAVVLDRHNRLLAKVKVPTTRDVTSGIANALRRVVAASSIDPKRIAYAMLGTTHCTNAIAERKDLNRVAVIRIGAPATMAIKPLFHWPRELREAVCSRSYIVRGGHEYDGQPISMLDEAEIARIAKDLKGEEIDAVAVTSVFSPVNPEHEERIKEILAEHLRREVPICLSHEIGSIGLLERENATALNAALIKVARRAIESFVRALKENEIEAKLFLGQNDGTLMSVDYALKYPVFTIASGPANSIRGAAFLSGVSDAIVIDIGGTTTDIGILSRGFPRVSAIPVEIGGVKTNFRMPDLVSIGLGGGSIVREENGTIRVGPESVGYRLLEEALVFGGKTLTATDIAAAMGRIKLGDPRALSSLSPRIVSRAAEYILARIEESIDKIKLTADPVPIVVVGGGSILLADDMPGAYQVIRPDNYEVANAIGVAIAQASGEIDKVFSYDVMPRGRALAQAKEMAMERARLAGADENTIEIIDLEEIPLAYLPGNAVRIKAKAAGNLKFAS